MDKTEFVDVEGKPLQVGQEVAFTGCARSREVERGTITRFTANKVFISHRDWRNRISETFTTKPHSYVLVIKEPNG